MKPHLTLFIGLLMPLATVAAPPVPATVGSVHQVAEDQLQVASSNAAAPTVGTALAIQAGHVPYKGSGATTYRTIGHARVIAAEASCVTAELADGHARRHDRAIVVHTIAFRHGDCRCPC